MIDYENIKYEIKALYNYPNSRKKFELKAVYNNVFYFSCGHWCTDTVFVDLINSKTGVQVYKDCQLNLF